MGLFSRKSKEDNDAEQIGKITTEMIKADQEGKPKKKIKLNEKLREYVEDYLYFYNRGSILYEMAGEDKTKLDEPMECFQKAIRLNPSYTKAWYRLGYAYYATEQDEKSIEAYEKVIELETKEGKEDFLYASHFCNLITMLEILVKRLNGDLTKWKTDEQYVSKIQEKLDTLRPIFNAVFDPKVFDTDEKIFVGCRENFIRILTDLEPDIARATLYSS